MQIPSPPIPLYGGLDLVTPPIVMPMGRAISCFNYEPAPRGYKRIQGYERYSGLPRPSEVTYYYLAFITGTATVAEGNTVTGATSGATGKALIDSVVSSGTFGGGNAAGYLILTNVTGTFVNGENLQVAAVTKCVASGSTIARGAPTDDLDTTYYRDAVTTARALISTVPGSGNILGVWFYNGVVYAFRNNAGGTAAVMHKSTTAGWSTVSLGRKLAFTTQTADIAEGATLTGATSGASAVVTRVALRTGTVAAGTGAGIITFASVTGAFQNGENLQVGGVTKAVASGADAAITLSPSGSYRFINHNFGGSTATYRMYGCDGVNLGFEFDGTVFVPIATGMATDTPKRLVAFKNQLFFAFAKGSLQNSAPGRPYNWTIISGASEIGLGEEIVDFSKYAQVLQVWGRNKIANLYGNTVDDFQLIELQEEGGAIANTVQVIGQPIYVDDIGLRKLNAAQSFADFNLGTLTELVRPIFEKNKTDGVTCSASVRDKARGMYRLFFSDGTGLSVYFGRKNVEVMPFDLGIQVVCICAGETATSDDTDQRQEIYFGSTDGYIYQFNVGTSFDGATVESMLRLAYNNLNSPTRNKSWHGADLHLDASSTLQLFVSAAYGYGDPDLPPTREIEFSINASGGVWNVSYWNNFVWSAMEVGGAKADLDGFGTNVSLAIFGSSIWDEPHSIHGVTFRYANRGFVR